jgi:hypothetical protein
VRCVQGFKNLRLRKSAEGPRVSQEAKQDEENLEHFHFATLSFLRVQRSFGLTVFFLVFGMSISRAAGLELTNLLLFPMVGSP